MMFGALDGLAVLLSFKNPFAVRRVSSTFLRGGSLANGRDATEVEMEVF